MSRASGVILFIMDLKAQIDEIIFDSSDHDEQLSRLASLAENTAMRFFNWIRSARLSNSELPAETLYKMFKNQHDL